MNLFSPAAILSIHPTRPGELSFYHEYSIQRCYGNALILKVLTFTKSFSSYCRQMIKLGERSFRERSFLKLFSLLTVFLFSFLSLCLSLVLHNITIRKFYFKYTVRYLLFCLHISVPTSMVPDACAKS